jgi:NADPH-ferrihemoprotein reductase
VLIWCCVSRRDAAIQIWTNNLIKNIEKDLLSMDLVAPFGVEKKLGDIEDLNLDPKVVSKLHCSKCLSRSNSSQNSPTLSRHNSPPRLKCIESKSSVENVTENYMYKNCIDVRVKNAKLLTASSSTRRVIHVELDTSGYDVAYNPGESIGVPCRNDRGLVSAILNHVQVKPETLCSIKNHDSADLFDHIPDSITARFALTCCCDITSKPSIKLLQVLFKSSSSHQDKERLEALIMCPDQLAQLAESHPNLLELLEMFPSAKPSIQDLIRNLSPLSARFYSIGSSPVNDPNSVHLAFSVVEKEVTKTSGGTKVFKGVCTSWLESLVLPVLLRSRGCGDFQDSVKIPIFLQAGSPFTDALESKKNLVMIGPGTGVVPFRGILRHLASQGDVSSGKHWLFVGHRRSSEDFIYKDEWDELLSGGVLDRVTAVFSRDPECPLKYVQDALYFHADEVKNLIADENTSFLVCGKSVLFDEVLSCFRKILVTKGSMTESDAEEYVEKMIEKKRFLAEVWG